MKGICFIEPLHDKTVKKIKVQTRRIMAEQPDDSGLHNHTLFPMSIDSDMTGFWGTVAETGESKEFKPRYKVGDVLYLKEPYKKWTRGLSEGRHTSILYKYGEDTPCDKVGTEGSSYYTDWKNKLFMPAYAARHYIKITSVRAERLQDISNEDCIKEGIEEERNWSNGTEWFTYCNGTHSFDTPREAYKALINSIDGKDTWNNNPWVWVYDYELIDRKEVQL